MDLVPYIFFERQEPGTSLCGQHCLNNVLQSHYFEATDLAAVAQQLDEEENATLDDNRPESVNMDDTGFFSVQVLDRCLQVWGLKLERWRSEEMKPYWEQPESQRAFILNLSQHWFPLRKFAASNRWFNLNSFNTSPQLVSDLYLGMTLSQAETEGYSVFVVVPVDGASSSSAGAASEQSILQTSRADKVSAGSDALGLGGEGQTGGGSSSAGVDWASYGNYEDEDAELQAALAASMVADGVSNSTPSFRPISALPSRPPSARQAPEDASNPVAASQARAQRQLELFQRDQAAALRGEDALMGLGNFGAPQRPSGPSSRAGSESSTPALQPMQTGGSSSRRRRQADPEPVMIVDSDEEDVVGSTEPVPPRRASGSTRSSQAPPAQQQQQQQRRRHDEDDEMMRQAIEASMREQETRDSAAVQTGARNAMDLEDDDDDDEIQIDYDDAYYYVDGTRSGPAHRPPPFVDPGTDYAAYGSYDRNYDEEDAELQRAIKASMEGLPEDYTPPVLDEPPPAPSPFISRPAATLSVPTPDVRDKAAASAQEGEVDDEDSEQEEDEEEAPVLTAEQMRAQRLARFGG